MPADNSAQNWANSVERRLQNLGLSVDKAFKQLNDYLATGGGSTPGMNLDQMSKRVQALEYWLKVYDSTTQQIAIRPERSVPATVTDKNTGATYINPVKEITKPFTLRTNPQTIVIPANGQAYAKFQVPVEENIRGDAEIFSLMLVAATSTSFRVEFTHTGRNQFLQNKPIHSMCAFGNMLSGPQPFIMYESIFLEPGQELLMTLTDFSGQQNTVELVAQARRFLGYDTQHLDRSGLINLFYSRLSFPYWFTSDNVITLPPGLSGSVQVNFTLDHTFDFEAGKNMSAGYNILTGTPQVVPCHIRMQEGRSGRQLTDNFAHILSLFGTSNFPIVYFEPLLLKRGTPMLVTVNNDVTGFANQGVDLVLHGRALPYRMPQQRAMDTNAATAGGVNRGTTISQKNISYAMPVEGSPNIGSRT